MDSQSSKVTWLFPSIPQLLNLSFSFPLLLPCHVSFLLFPLFTLNLDFLWVPLRKRRDSVRRVAGNNPKMKRIKVLARLPLLSIRLFLEFKNKHIIPSSSYWLNDQWRHISNPAERIMTDLLPYNKAVPFTCYCGNRTWSDDRLRSKDLDNSLVLMLTWYKTKDFKNFKKNN